MKNVKWLASLLVALFLPAQNAAAVGFAGSQVAPNQWTYDLTYDPLDNYSIFQPFTTITLNGLSGVTSATAPVSTDFPTGPGSFIDLVNLEWSAQVLNGGTTVQWTHVGPGTGNFGSAQHVFGFSIFAAEAVNGVASLATSGFSRDTSSPLPNGSFNVDITGSVAGPVAAVAAIPEPETYAMLLAGFALMGLVVRRRQREFIS